MFNLDNYFERIEASTVVAWFILIFTLFPFLVLCIYNVPLGDDFWYANAFRRNGMIETQVLWYKQWSGRYMATFLISTLNPLSYGYMNLGYLHPLILLLGTAFSLKFLINTIIDFFKLKISKVLSLSILLFFYLNYLPDVGESFYWMAGAYTYQVPVIFLFLYIAFLIRIFNSKSVVENIVNLTLAIFCLFVILGSNEVIVVYVCFLNAIIAVFVFFRDKKIFFKFLPLLVATIVLSFIMIFAEGNFARAAIFEKPSFHLLKATFHSLSRGIFVLFFWIPTFLLLLLFIPGISSINTSREQLPPINSRSRSAIIIGGAILLILIVFIGFFPSVYTTSWIPKRAYTSIFVAFMIVFAVLFILMLRYFPVLSQLNNKLSNSSKTSKIFLCILIIALSQNSNVMNAYVDLTSGKASSYHNQVMNTYKELDNYTQDTIFVKELAKRPLILPIRWPQKHNRLANTIWEGYFNIERVELD